MSLRHTVATVASVACLLSPTPAHAEGAPLAWGGARPIADWLSTGLVGANLTLETIHAWRAPDRGHALWCEAARIGVAIGAAEATKRLIHRDRPDGSDRLSFFSEHTALAVASSGWRVNVSVPIALGAGYLRTGSAKHYVSDVLVGAGVGWAARFVCRGGAS